MSTTITNKAGIDLPYWRPLANAATAASTGSCLAIDQRNSEDRIPIVYYLPAAANLYAYYPKNDDWGFTAYGAALAGTFGAGNALVVAPSVGPRGTITTGATTTSVVLSTALPASVGVNQLANRGDGTGFKLRIVDNGSGGSGKTAEVYITGNTSGTTPTIYWTGAIGFTPVTGSAYEFLSGVVYLLNAGTQASGSFKSFDIATSAFSSLSITNLPATITTDSCFVAFDELYVPNTQTPGTGFLGNLTATGSSSTSLTGQAASGDSGVVANQYRNFQIRIIQDTSNVTAVGQRRVIVSHTAGTSPVYTVTTWTVTPSTTAQYVIENANWLFLWTSAATTTYVYANYAITGGGSSGTGLTANTWTSTQFNARGGAVGAGCSAWQPFGMTLDTQANARYSYTYSMRGGTTSTIDLFDIAAAAAGTATAAITYGGPQNVAAAGNSAAYESLGVPAGRYTYFNWQATTHCSRFDNINRVMEPIAFMPYATAGTVVGSRMCIYPFFDGATSIGTTILQRGSAVEMFGCLNLR